MASGYVVQTVHGYWKAQCLPCSFVDIKRLHREDAVANLKAHYKSREHRKRFAKRRRSV